jgi:hypothetical protein
MPVVVFKNLQLSKIAATESLVFESESLDRDERF